jgi:hypothetical protein
MRQQFHRVFISFAMAKLRTQKIFSMAANLAGNFQSEAMKWLRL